MNTYTTESATVELKDLVRQISINGNSVTDHLDKCLSFIAAGRAMLALEDGCQHATHVLDEAVRQLGQLAILLADDASEYDLNIDYRG